jgi:predicted phosphodiesterase
MTKRGLIKFAAISDTHFGSKYALHAPLEDFVKRAHAAGVRTILHAGDFLDGCNMYRGQEFELSSHGLDEQIREAGMALPVMKDLQYMFICGNHDLSFFRSAGADPGIAIERALSELGVTYLGQEHATVQIEADNGGKLTVDLLHPGGAPAYASSYSLQKYVSALVPGHKPQVLLFGHEHKYVSILERNVFGFKVATFQGQTPYMLRKTLTPSVGGLVFEVEVAPDSSILSLRHEMIPYYSARAKYIRAR